MCAVPKTVCVCMYACVCACVCEREREKEENRHDLKMARAQFISIISVVRSAMAHYTSLTMVL